MRVIPRLAGLVAFVLVVTACAGDAATTTTQGVTTTEGVTTTTEATTTTGGETTSSTTIAPTSPLDAMVGAMVEDPLYGTGFHQMTLDPPENLGASPEAFGGRLIWSVDPVTGDTPGMNVLELNLLEGSTDGATQGACMDEPTPFEVCAAMTGIPPDVLVVSAYLQNISPDVDTTAIPTAIVLYRLGDPGWEALVSISDTIVLDYLETTTDYAAWNPEEGTRYARTTLTSLDWDGSTAHFIADVDVLIISGSDYFTAQIECTLDGALDCTLLSDDGVLRPGDEGPSVEALQQQLIDLGYLTTPADGKYGAQTESAVRRFQRDYRLSRDGIAGPQTQALIDDILSGTSDIVLASKDGVGPVAFGTAVTTALPALIERLGTPDYTLGWEMGPCGPTPPYGGWEWYKVTWGGFTAWFTEKSGSRRFDGWQVTDLADVPANLYFAGGIAPSWTWSNFDSMGAVYDPFYGWWSHGSLGYGLGRFVSPPSNPPANNAKVLGWGTGTAAILYDC